MPAVVPSMGSQLFIKDPEWIIAYQWMRYTRQPGATIPILSDLIISLPSQVARFGKHPDILAANMQSDLQGVLSRVFGIDRSITVSVSAAQSGLTTSTITMTFSYTKVDGDVNQIGTSIELDPVSGRLILPFEKLPDLFAKQGVLS